MGYFVKYVWALGNKKYFDFTQVNFVLNKVIADIAEYTFCHF